MYRCDVRVKLFYARACRSISTYILSKFGLQPHLLLHALSLLEPRYGSVFVVAMHATGGASYPIYNLGMH